MFAGEVNAQSSIYHATPALGVHAVEVYVCIADVDEAFKKAELLCKKIKNLSFEDYEISCSIGICVLGNDSNDYESLYAHADKALYRAKRSGKNCALVYDPVIDRDY